MTEYIMKALGLKRWYIPFDKLYTPLVVYHSRMICKTKYASWEKFDQWLLETYGARLVRLDSQYDKLWSSKHSTSASIEFTNEADYLAFKLRWL